MRLGQDTLLVLAREDAALRSASPLLSTARAEEYVFVFFMLNFLPVLLGNQGCEKCLSYIGTEGLNPLVRGVLHAKCQG